MSKRGLIFTLALLIIILFSFIALYFGYFLISPAGIDKKEIIFIVNKGTGLRAVANELRRKRIIKNKDLFILCAILKGGTKDIKAGEYSLNQSMSPVTIFNILSTGAIKTYTVTIPEGLTTQQTADLLATKNLVNTREFISLVMDKTFTASYHIDGTSLEGYLFPDTYYFTKDATPEKIISSMVKRFWSVFKPEWKNRAKTLGLTIHQVVTLASIIEKETGAAVERPIISSVFHNRLKRGIRLESDPTVIYGIEDFNGNITRRDLEEDTLYNTYRIKGLPPGPIANAGTKAIEAALYPAETRFLYFVSKKDNTHQFSTNLKDHNRAVRKYQLSR